MRAEQSERGSSKSNCRRIEGAITPKTAMLFWVNISEPKGKISQRSSWPPASAPEFPCLTSSGRVAASR